MRFYLTCQPEALSLGYSSECDLSVYMIMLQLVPSTCGESLHHFLETLLNKLAAYMHCPCQCIVDALSCGVFLYLVRRAAELPANDSFCLK
jgi:hypothetical protein